MFCLGGRAAAFFVWPPQGLELCPAAALGAEPAYVAAQSQGGGAPPAAARDEFTFRVPIIRAWPVGDSGRLLWGKIDTSMLRSR